MDTEQDQIQLVQCISSMFKRVIGDGYWSHESHLEEVMAGSGMEQNWRVNTGTLPLLQRLSRSYQCEEESTSRYWPEPG
ncbi:hypothetical protein EVAR_73160_1 [Eumeta japonica]|uniref:Uncharacterized protein n=1 Tax=Eumeta variegata TaxID=151549 RepID=A0A4C1TL67_EUMVA|nr:hypothetical protein EVAR_73160_1 [Eumeta japonica]